MRIKPKFPVEAIPFVTTTREFSLEEQKEYGIKTSTGIQNAYRTAFALGQGASRKDTTFDKSKGIHTCCGSKVAWRHKTACKLLQFAD